jgi:hypothetical protein
VQAVFTAMRFTPHECEINTIKGHCVHILHQSGVAFHSHFYRGLPTGWSNALNSHSPFMFYFFAIIEAAQFFKRKKCTRFFGILDLFKRFRSDMMTSIASYFCSQKL